jgi:signal transduction histidine kinase
LQTWSRVSSGARGEAAAEVTVRCGPSEVLIQVTDNGTGQPASAQADGGHGLAGMRERAASFGGEFKAGRCQQADRIRARLPVSEQLRPAWPVA